MWTAVVGAGVGLGSATAKKHHKKGKPKVSLKGWIYSLTDYQITHQNFSASKGGTITFCDTKNKRIFFLGMVERWKHEKPTGTFQVVFTGPNLNFSSGTLTWGSAKGRYPGYPNGVNAHAQGQSEFMAGTYTGSIIVGGKTVASQTVTIAQSC
jgi:hypothetical protein